MLESYFDDSSDGRRDTYYVCGGLLGDEEQWNLVSAMWSHETHGLQKPFRSTDCEGGHGQFHNWPLERRNDLMARLVAVIRRFKVYGYTSVVPIQTYRVYFPDRGQQAPLLLAATQSIMNMAHLANLMRKDVRVWFESGPGKGEITDQFNAITELKWGPARRLRGPYFDTKKLWPLQSADLIAREAFKHSVNLGTRPAREPLKRMANVLYFTRWTDQTLEYLARNGGPEKLELLCSWDQRPDVPPMEMFWKRF
jgi:hypothetical protein